MLCHFGASRISCHTKSSPNEDIESIPIIAAPVKFDFKIIRWGGKCLNSFKNDPTGLTSSFGRIAEKTDRSGFWIPSPVRIQVTALKTG
jgi:hypothetical protein